MAGSFLSISQLAVDLRVAALAQAHEVVLIVCAATAHGNDVVDLFNCCIFSGHEAAFTERVLMNITVANTLPCAAIGAVHIGAALVFVILSSCLFPVLLTVLLVGQVGAAGICAGALGFHGHNLIFLPFRV